MVFFLTNVISLQLLMLINIKINKYKRPVTHKKCFSDPVMNQSNI